MIQYVRLSLETAYSSILYVIGAKPIETANELLKFFISLKP
jgi:hypothetical protein